LINISCDIASRVYEKLNELEICYNSISHEAVFTMQECALREKELGAVTAKNFFLATKHRDHFYLCLVRPQARFKSVDISRQIGSTRLNFGPEDHLLRLLKVHPGSVSPMGLIFDEQNEVQLLVDSELTKLDKIAFHPCDNTQTLAMKTCDFFGRFLPAIGHEPRFVQIHDFMT